ncbi:hypothetical protein [Aliarcobacter butzleri]|uniref:hypothetical protein n=1 Tax=Aliarcobacter butzleri TaxID=28197 RepID=UPI00126992B1|nr:hypothetical protein [Aliarcobacter butzleri]
MSYELFEKAAAINSQFEIIPSKTSIYAKGIVIDNRGYMHYKGKVHIPNLVKLEDLPIEIRSLFLEKKLPAKTIEKSVVERDKEEEEEEENEVPPQNDIEILGKETFSNLNKILNDQLNKIANPGEGIDMNQELKKANTICNIADKVIGIADLSLKAEMFKYKKKYPNGKSLYRD